MLFVIGVSNGAQEVGVPVGPTHIFRRAGVFSRSALYASRPSRTAGIRIFHDNNMVPVIAKVIDVIEATRLVD